MLATPLTAAELCGQVRAASRLDRDLLADIEAIGSRLAAVPAGTRSTLGTLLELVDGGEALVLAQLERLRAAGFVEAIAVDVQSVLWRRLPL